MLHGSVLFATRLLVVELSFTLGAQSSRSDQGGVQRKGSSYSRPPPACWCHRGVSYAQQQHHCNALPVSTPAWQLSAYSQQSATTDAPRRAQRLGVWIGHCLPAGQAGYCSSLVHWQNISHSSSYFYSASIHTRLPTAEWRNEAGATGVCFNEWQEENRLWLKLSSKCCWTFCCAEHVFDFEAAAWCVASSPWYPAADPTMWIIIVDVHSIGHWRKVQHVGLQTAYSEDTDMHKIIKMVLALLILPDEHIPLAFTYLQGKAACAT